MLFKQQAWHGMALQYWVLGVIRHRTFGEGKFTGQKLEGNKRSTASILHALAMALHHGTLNAVMNEVVSWRWVNVASLFITVVSCQVAASQPYVSRAAT